MAPRDPAHIGSANVGVSVQARGDVGGVRAREGRVAMSSAARSRGVGSQLLREALDRCAALDPSAPVLLDAQAHLTHWYARFGFEVAGEGCDEDGTLHLPMRRAL
jgi:ElaA protein